MNRMINLSTIAEQCRLILSGGKITADFRPSEQEMILFARQAFSTLVRLSFFENKKEGDSFVDGGFIYTFDDVEVSKDLNKDLYYSELPSSTIVLPQEIGIYQICPMKNQGDFYIPLRNGFNALMQGLDVGQLEGRFGYYVEGKRIYYTFKPVDAPESVMMKLVVALDQLTGDDMIFMPKDMELMIVQQAVQLYQVEKGIQPDLENDNVKR